MSILLNESFKYAIITPYRDYSSLDKKSHILYIKERFNKILTHSGDFSETYGHPISISDVFSGIGSACETYGKYFKLPKKGKRKTRNVYRDNEEANIDDIVPLMFYTKDHEEYFTTNQRHIKYHYGRMLSEIRIVSQGRSIEKEGDKLIIRSFTHYAHRGVNEIYFKNSAIKVTISINLKTGNFTIREYAKNGSKNKTINFKTNYFRGLLKYTTKDALRLNTHKPPTKSKIYKESMSFFDNERFTKIICQKLHVPNPPINLFDKYQVFIKSLIPLFIDKKKIKAPNINYAHLITNYYPTEKYLKKNNRKLVAACLDAVNIKSKLTIKIFHKYPFMNFGEFTELIYLFGNDFHNFVSLIKPDYFEYSDQINTEPKISNVYGGEGEIISSLLSKKGNYDRFNISNNEKINIVKIINDKTRIISDYLYTHVTIPQAPLRDMLCQFKDHFEIMENIKQYIPNISIKAKTVEQFNKEHTEYSLLISKINKGYTMKYEYDPNLIEWIEEPIGWDYYPYILKTEDDYFEEGNTMHHCVNSYLKNTNSIIISIRCKLTDERVTCEYDIKSGRPIQQKYFSNQAPPESFLPAISILHNKVKIAAEEGNLKWLEIVKAPLLIEGIPIKPIPQEKTPLMQQLEYRELEQYFV